MVTPRVDLFYDSIWNDITTYVYTRDSIRITRGTPNEGNTADPTSIALTLDNRDGRFSPRNPTGALYGKIGRNTPLRVSIPGAAKALICTGSTTGNATTPDNAALDVAGDIDLRADIRLDTLSHTVGILSKGQINATTYAYGLLIGFTAGVPHLTLRWSANGSTLLSVDHDMTELRFNERIAVRATLDVDNGAGGRVATFYTAPTMAGPWTQHGTATTTAGTTSIFNSTRALFIGQTDNASTDAFTGSIYGVEVRNGIAGTAVANPDFTAQALGAGSFTDAAGRAWTVTADAVIGAEVLTRAVGEVSAWPQNWDQTGRDTYVQIQAAGILRRLGQGQPVTQTGIKSFVTDGGFDQCWPGDTLYSLSAAKTPLSFNNCAANVHLGDGAMGSGLPSGMLVDTTNVVTTPNFFPSSGYIQGFIGAGNGGTFEAAGFIFKCGDMSAVTLYLHSYGTLTPGGYLLYLSRVDGIFTISKGTFDPEAGWTYTSICTSTVIGGIFTDGALHSVLWTIVDAGATLTHTIYLDGVSIGSGSDALSSLQGMADFELTYDLVYAANPLPVALSYLTFWSDQYGGQTLPNAVTFAQAADGYIGETAGRRIQRLCSENGVPFSQVGDLDATAAMGPQGSGILLDLIREAAATDGGGVYESRGGLGLTYRTRASRYNRTVDVTLDYANKVFAASPQPTDDDQQLHNDVTVTNYDGSTAEAVLTSGALSIQAPPNGVNTYPTSFSVNVVTGGVLPDQASWRLHLGTLDEGRYPQISLNMRRPQITGDAALTAAITGMDVDSVLKIQHLPSSLPPDDVYQLVAGYSEQIDQTKWEINPINCLPYSPYQVAVYSTDRYDAEGSTVYEAATSGATSLKVKSDIGQPWTTDGAMVPFDINVAGERMTVTAVTGDGPPVFVAASTAVTGNNASLTPSLPAGTAAGDMVFILSTIRNTGATVAIPANWTGSGGGNYGVLYRVYDGVWTMPTCTYSGGAAGDDTLAQAVTFRRAQAPSPLILGGGPVYSNSSQQDIPFTWDTSQGGVNVTTLLTAWKQDDWTSLTDPAGWTKIGEATSTVGNDAGQAIYYNADRAAMGSTGTIAVTGGATAISQQMKTAIRGYQTLTVTRSVNGVVKAQPVGGTVRLWTTPRYAL